MTKVNVTNAFVRRSMNPPPDYNAMFLKIELNIPVEWWPDSYEKEGGSLEGMWSSDNLGE